MRALLLLSVMTGIVDRIEGDMAVVEWSDDRPHGLLPAEALPPGAGEGAAIQIRRTPRRVIVRTIPIHRAHRAQPPRSHHADP